MVEKQKYVIVSGRPQLVADIKKGLSEDCFECVGEFASTMGFARVSNASDLNSEGIVVILDSYLEIKLPGEDGAEGVFSLEHLSPSVQLMQFVHATSDHWCVLLITHPICENDMKLGIDPPHCCPLSCGVERWFDLLPSHIDQAWAVHTIQAGEGVM